MTTNIVNEKKYPYISDFTNFVTLIVDNETHSVTKKSVGETRFNAILESIRKGDFDEALRLADIRKAISSFSSGNIQIAGNVLQYKGTQIHNTLTKRIIAMVQNGDDATGMINFLENLMANPSHTAVMELYDFLETSNLPITPEGNFLAYKIVNKDYKDIYTKTIDNSVGAHVQQERNSVDDNRHNTCSNGLHFCGKGYLKSYGSEDRKTDRIMLLSINPKDVVSIPTDYNFMKGRCCEYTVLADITDVDAKLETKSVYGYKPAVTSSGGEVTEKTSDVVNLDNSTSV